MTRMHSRRHAIAMIAVSLAIAGGTWRPADAQQAPKQQAAPRASVKSIAAQLGVRVQPRDDDDLDLGASFTAQLEDPEKLGAFGIQGMHAGARVTVFRSAPDKVRVEADEMEPKEARGAATIKLDAKGALEPVGKG
jgi:hypothetical protein